MKNNSEIQKFLNLNFNDIVFLCGAGISISPPSSLPTVRFFVESILKECNADQESIEKVLSRLYETNIRFEGLIDEIRKYSDPNLRVGDLFSSSSYNKIHSFLSHAIKEGANVITTNFDNCIENSNFEWFTSESCNNRIVYDGDDLNTDMEISNNALYKVHGSTSLFDKDSKHLVITLTSLAKTNNGFLLLPCWRKTLLSLLKNKVLVVMGYSCSDDFDITPILKDAEIRNILWLNYDPSKDLPVLDNKINNENIVRLAKKHCLDYFNGKLDSLLSMWGEIYGFELKEGSSSNNYTMKDYVKENYPSDGDKQVLINHILCNYSVYDEVAYTDDNILTKIQTLKTLYRLRYYEEVINFYNNELSSSAENFEVMYFLSSAFCKTNNFDKAVDVAKACAEGLEKSNDYVFYLNALLNYASILVETFTKNELHENVLIDTAYDIYKFLETESKGLNIELGAMAYWGLGYIKKIKGNFNEAENYYLRALDIYKKIGDEYNIQIINANLDELDELRVVNIDSYV